MKVTKASDGNGTPKRKHRPASTPEGREHQIQALAMELAYERLLDKTASNQLICEIIKSASTERQLKKEIMEQQKELLQAKTEAIRDQKDMKELYSNALNAMRNYSGAIVDEDGEDEDVF